MVYARVYFDAKWGIDFVHMQSIKDRIDFLANLPRIENEGKDGAEQYSTLLEEAGNPGDYDIVRNITIGWKKSSKGWEESYFYKVSDTYDSSDRGGLTELGIRKYSHVELGKMLEE